MTGLSGFSTPAGHIGTNVRIDHDISLLIPEIWCRLSPEERTPEFLLREDLMEKMEDYEYDGKKILASRLGYRITSRFIRRFGGRVFDNPGKVFDDDIMRPESQDEAAFADGILYITEAQERVAQNYMQDGCLDLACPPLRALLHIMVEGQYNGNDVTHPDIRAMFTLKSMLQSDWYAERLKTRRQRDQQLWQRHLSYVQGIVNQPEFASDLERLDLDSRLKYAESELARVSSSEYLNKLNGCIGADRLR